MRYAKCAYRRAYGWMIAAALAMPLYANSLQTGIPRAQKRESRRKIDQLEEQ